MQVAKSWLVSAGARQPEPVVKPDSRKPLMWATAGRSPIPLTTRRRSTRSSSALRYGSTAGSLRTAAYLIDTQVPSSTSRATASRPAIVSEPKPSSLFR